MKKSTRVAAVVAAAALAVSTATGTAAAQSGLPDFGDILDPFTGSAGDIAGGSADLSPLEGSMAPEGSADLLGGSSELPALSSEPLGGSSELPALSSEPLGGSAEIGSTDMAPLSTNLLGGSADFQSSDLAPLTGSEDMGSTEMSPLSTELNFLGGSAELPPLSANFPDGSTAGIGGSSERIGEGISGSLTNGSANQLAGSVESNSADPIIGSIAEGEVQGALAGSIEDVSGSLAGDTGSTGQSSDTITGSFGDLTEVNGSLTALTGSLENGSLRSTASTNLGSEFGAVSSLESAASIESSAGPGVLPILSLGGVGLAAGVALGAGVDLPPLPGAPGVCELPQQYIDQLAGVGSAQAADCPRP